MARKELSNFELTPHFHHSIKFKERKFKFTPKQRKFLSTLLNSSVKVFFVSGPAGSSKTYMSLYGCLRLLAEDPQKELLLKTYASVIEKYEQRPEYELILGENKNVF